MIYFAFSDECGKHKQPNKKFIRANPFYIRATYIIKGDDWITKMVICRLFFLKCLALNQELYIPMLFPQWESHSIFHH